MRRLLPELLLTAKTRRWSPPKRRHEILVQCALLAPRAEHRVTQSAKRRSRTGSANYASDSLHRLLQLTRPVTDTPSVHAGADLVMGGGGVSKRWADGGEPYRPGGLLVL